MVITRNSLDFKLEDLIHHCGREALFSQISFVKNRERVESNALRCENMELVLPPKPRGAMTTHITINMPQWAMLASKHNCTILMTHHTSKESDNPFDGFWVAKL